MPNPMMNDKTVDEAASAPGWGAPAVAARSTVIPGTPIDDGPISGWQSSVMTIRGTMTAGGVLLVLLLASASFGWAAPPMPAGVLEASRRRHLSPSWLASAAQSHCGSSQ